MGSLLLLLLCGTIAGYAQSAPISSDRLLVVNLKEHSVLLVDPQKKKIVATIPVGISGHEVVLSRDQRYAYVPIYSDAVIGEPGIDGRTIDVIDLNTLKVVANIDLGHPLRPHRAVFGPDGLLYVTAELANVVLIVDPQKRTVIGHIPTGKPLSHMLVLSSDGLRGYTSNVSTGTVSVLDIPSRKLVTVISVAKHIQRIAISNDGRWVFTSDQDAPRVAVIDTNTNAVSQWIPVEGIPFATAPTPDGRWLLVAESKSDKGLVEVVDLQTMKVKNSFTVEAQPFGFFLHGDLAYMTCIVAGRIEVLNLRTWAMETPIIMTPGVDGMAWISTTDQPQQKADK